MHGTAHGVLKNDSLSSHGKKPDGSGRRIQRLLREPPSDLVAGVLDTDLARLSPTDQLADVTRYFAAYNLVCAPVVDDQDHLLGAVTVDDVIDHLLPENWRESGRHPESADTTQVTDRQTRGRREANHA